MTITANKYVKALGALGMPVEVMNEALEIYDAEPCLAGILQSPAVYNEQKYAAIDRIFPEKSRNLLKILCRQADMGFFPEIVEGYQQYVNEHQQVLDAVLRYVTPPSETQREEMKSFLCSKYEVKDVNLVEVEDDSLIGGFILEVDGSEYDWSLRGRIAGLRNKLAGGE